MVNSFGKTGCRLFPIIISIIFTLLLICSCTVTQAFTFPSRLSDSGSSSTSILTDDFFNLLLEDFSQFADGASLSLDASIESFSSALSENSKVNHVNFEKTSDSSWDGSFNFADFNTLVALLSGEEDQDIITLTRSGLCSRFVFRLNINNFSTLKKLVPFLENPNIAAYGPEYNQYLTEEDYLEMIAFILGDDGPESIKSSSVTLVLNTPSEITATNGETVSDKQVKFTIPLIDILLLKDEILFWCEY